MAAELRARAILREVYSKPRIGIEIGVAKGHLSQQLLLHDPNLFLYLVDPWAPQDSAAYRATEDNYAFFDAAFLEKLYQLTLHNLSLFEARYEIRRQTSLEAANGFPNEYADFVFIDADHSYEATKEDCWAWWPKVKPRGLLCGHDYRTDKKFGVIQAVDEFAAKMQKQIRLGDNFTWFMTK